jgi:class 3 adenylate cyclase
VASHAENAPEPVLLIIADISGYTRYMTANAKTLAHSQTLITELVEAIIKQVQAPLAVAKLEGDAIFLFCRRPKDAARWTEIRADISRKLLEFFRRFREKLGELGRSNLCTCHACTHLEKLRLKIIVHSGEALFHRVLHFDELAGPDVIIVHRLLKNSVKAAQYLLLTEAARRELKFPGTMTFKTGSEAYEDIGRIKTEFHDFDSDPPQAPVNSRKTFRARYRESLQLYLRLWFGPFSGREQFRNLPAESSRTGRTGFAVLTAVLTPVMVPVAAVMVVFHVLKADT